MCVENHRPHFIRFNAGEQGGSAEDGGPQSMGDEAYQEGCAKMVGARHAVPLRTKRSAGYFFGRDSGGTSPFTR